MIQVMDNGVVRDATPAEIAEINQRGDDLKNLTEMDYVSAIQQMLDAKARERRYYGLESASTYIASTNPQFQDEATALIAWRDGVWLTAYDLFDKVTTGVIPKPTIPALLAMLPAFNWPAARAQQTVTQQ